MEEQNIKIDDGIQNQIQPEGKGEEKEIIGIIVVDKPEGKTSTQIDNLIKRKLRVKVGHIGTIDPFASGVLPIAIGRATKFIPYLIDKDREYIAEILLGKRTDTDDITGREIYSIDESDVKKLSLKQIEEVVKSFEGIIEQVPPYYSAKKYMGKPLYEWAREGKLLELQPKRVTIYSIEILGISLPSIKLKILSSSGMYVRSLARDIGEKLTINGKKVGGTLKSLRRIRCGHFTEKDTIPFEAIKHMSADQIKKYIREVTPELLDMRKIVIRGQDIQRVMSGAPPKFKVQGNNGEKVILTDDSGKIIAIGEIKKGIVQIKRVVASTVSTPHR
jgi:tRNA pseudouridine55 synthase